jgi:hypothetical protein
MLGPDVRATLDEAILTVVDRLAVDDRLILATSVVLATGRRP